MSMPWPTAEEALEMPVEQLAMRLLDRLAATDQRADGTFTLRVGQIKVWVHEWDRAKGSTRSQSEAVQARPQARAKLATEMIQAAEAAYKPVAAHPSSKSSRYRADSK
jgi:hypothetical protein